mgnify:CR=1 FL=1
MTENIIEYKEFIGSVNYSDGDECFYGKIEGINDLVTFEKGSFNVRIEPKLHYDAIYTALKKGMSLNQFVAEAIKNNIDKKVLNHS